MSAIRRYGTSALCTILHTVAGLSAMAFGCLLIAVATLVAPSFVGGPGLNLLVSGGTVAENVGQPGAETFVSLPVQGLVQRSGALAVLVGLLQLAVGLFGGPAVITLAAGVFPCVRYGLRESVREAPVAGIGPVGLGTPLRSAAGFGPVIGDPRGVCYSVRAWGATELVTPSGDVIPC